MKERDSFRASVESLTRELASMESQVSLLRDGQGGLAAESERLKSENAELSARLSEADPRRHRWSPLRRPSVR